MFGCGETKHRLVNNLPAIACALQNLFDEGKHHLRLPRRPLCNDRNSILNLRRAHLLDVQRLEDA